MDILIEDLVPGVASRDHSIPAMDGGEAVRLFVGGILDLVIGSAPSDLNTLEKLATAIGNNPNFATAVTAALAGKLAKDGSNVGNDAAKTALLAALGIDTSGAAGDLFYRNAAGLLVKLPKGAAGQFLRQNSALTAPEWVRGWEPIADGTISNQSQRDFLDLDAYRRLRLYLYGTVATDATNLVLLTSTDNVTFANSNGDYAGQWEGAISSAPTTPTGGALNTANGNVFFLTAAGVGNAANEAADITVNIGEFNQAGYARIRSEWTAVEASGALVTAHNSGVRSQATARKAIRIKAAAGNFSGHFVLEGFRG